MYPIHRWQALANLTAGEQDALLTLAKSERTYSARDTIRSEGDVATGIYVHIDGWIASSVLLRTGGRLIQKIHLPGDMLGTPSMVTTRAADTLTAITDVRVASVSFKTLSALFRRFPRLAALFTFSVQVERLALMDALAVLGRGSAKERLARLLLDFHDRLLPLGAVTDDAFNLPLTQTVIGDLVGLTSVHVNRELRELSERGLIARRGPRIGWSTSQRCARSHRSSHGACSSSLRGFRPPLLVPHDAAIEPARPR